MKNKELLPKIKDAAPNLLLINDEMHYTLNPTQRTSALLEISRLCWRFVAMSGTVVKDRKIKYLIPWLEQVVTFEVTDKNFWAAMTTMISKKIDLKIKIRRKEHKVKFLKGDGEKYIESMEENSRKGFREAVRYCLDACEEGMIDLILNLTDKKKIVFVLAGNKKAMEYIYEELLFSGFKEKQLYKITGDNPITYYPEDPRDIKVIITTPTHVTGYTITKATDMVQTVYFVGQHVRDQAEGRLIRIGQKKTVTIHTVTVGILSDIMKKYSLVRNANAAFKFALEQKKE